MELTVYGGILTVKNDFHVMSLLVLEFKEELERKTVFHFEPRAYSF